MSDFELPEQQRVSIKDTSTQSRSIAPNEVGLIIAIIFAVILWNFIGNWEHQDSSARYLLAFYDYTIVEPLKLIPEFYEYCRTLELTPYNNLNWFLAILAICFYLFVLIPFLLKIILNFLEKLNLYNYRWKLFFLPALLYLAFHFTTWLFR